MYGDATDDVMDVTALKEYFISLSNHHSTVAPYTVLILSWGITSHLTLGWIQRVNKVAKLFVIHP
jgi:hypothetical protein